MHPIKGSLVIFFLLFFGTSLLTPLLTHATATPCEVNTDCGDSLYHCIGYNPNISMSGTCTCRWGSFESIGSFITNNSNSPYPDICALINEFDSGGQSGNRYGAAIKVISLFVKLLTALVIMAALISIVIGGYIYMTAGGSADRVRLAKVWIISSLLGITIALSAWVILNTVNPSTINF